MLPLAVRIGISLVIVLVGAGAVFTGWVSLNALSRPEIVLSVWPDNALALTHQSERLRRAGKTSPESGKIIGQKLMRAFPLSEASLIYAADALSAKGEEDAARKVYSAALRRQPRNIPALSYLAADAILHERFREAAEYLLRLGSISPESEAAFVSAMAVIAETDESSGTFESLLESKTPLALKALEQLNQTSLNTERLVRLNSIVPTYSGKFISRLMEQHGPEAAFLVWLSFLPASETDGFEWPHDSAFVGSPAPAPFNWTLSPFAELLQQGGLYVSTSRRRFVNEVFARQTIILTPGLYQLEAYMDGETSLDGAKIHWTVNCIGTKLEIGRLDTGNLKPVIETKVLVFEVPSSGCSAQEVAIQARAGLYPVKARANVRKVSINKLADQL